ncbi:hypothetical protein D021_3612B, partial [Vibrio parahaemolyticus 10296]
NGSNHLPFKQFQLLRDIPAQFGCAKNKCLNRLSNHMWTNTHPAYFNFW